MTELAIQTKDLKAQGACAIEQAGKFEIHSDLTNEIAGDALRNLKRTLKEIDDRFGPPIKKAHEAHKAFLALKNDIAHPFLGCEKIYRAKIGAYQFKQEQLRQAEADRQRKIAQDEAERVKLEQAAKLEAEGHKEEADRVIESPVIAPAPIIPVAPKVEGISRRQTWKFRVVAEELIPRPYLIPDEKSLGTLARSLKGKAIVPGVEFYCEESVAVRA